MVDKYPQPYTTAPPALVSYDYTDIATSIGIQTFYLIESEDSGGKDYHLTQKTDYSSSAVLQNSVGANSDLDYDTTPFQTPQTVRGTASLSLPIWCHADDSMAFTVQLKKWDGSSETNLSSAVTLTATQDGERMLFFQMPLTETLLKTGDVLRLSVAADETGSNNCKYGQDPAGRTHAQLTTTTQSKLNVPFKLDL